RERNPLADGDDHLRVGQALGELVVVARRFAKPHHFVATQQLEALQPVHHIVPFSAGSAVDTLARIPGQKLSELWGQQVVVDNRVGANTIIGTEAAAKAPPDGYTLVLTNDAALATNPALYPKLPYHPLRDFAPIALAASIPIVLVVTSSFPASSVQELVKEAKANPGKINYASGGNGSAQHLPMEMFKLAAGIDLVHVPYKGLGPA